MSCYVSQTLIIYKILESAHNFDGTKLYALIHGLRYSKILQNNGFFFSWQRMEVHTQYHVEQWHWGWRPLHIINESIGPFQIRGNRHRNQTSFVLFRHDNPQQCCKLHVPFCQGLWITLNILYTVQELNVLQIAVRKNFLTCAHTLVSAIEKVAPGVMFWRKRSHPLIPFHDNQATVLWACLHGHLDIVKFLHEMYHMNMNVRDIVCSFSTCQHKFPTSTPTAVYVR